APTPKRQRAAARSATAPTPTRSRLLLAGALDHRAQLVEILAGQLVAFELEQRRYRLGRRAAKEGLDQMRQSRVPGAAPGDRRQVDVARPVLLVTELTLVLEHADQRAHGRIARRIRELGEDLVDGHATVAVDDIHDLPLAPTEVLKLGLARSHRVC